MAAGMLAVALLAHMMDPVSYGRFLVIWSFVAIAATLVRIGLTRSLAREIPTCRGEADYDGAFALAAAGWWVAFAAGLIGAPLLAAAAVMTVPGLGVRLPKRDVLCAARGLVCGSARWT